MSGSYPDQSRQAELAVQGFQQGNYNQAIAICTGILRNQPHHLVALAVLGASYLRLGQADTAVPILSKITELTPNDPKAWNNLGYAHVSAGRLDHAVQALQRALSLDNNFAGAHNNLGLALQGQKRWTEACASFGRAISASPTEAEAYNNRGSVLMRLSRMSEALSDFESALRLRANFVEAHVNLSRLMIALNRIEDAQKAIDCALSIKPHDATALWAKSQALLVRGDYTEGWKLYEHRWHSIQFGHPPRNFPQPLWLGRASLTGRRLLVHAEQGFGDTMQFCRYIPLVAKQADQVTLIAQPELTQLLNHSALGATVITPADRLPSFDMHCPLMSLPHAFGTTLETVPNDIPYLNADPARVAKWQSRLGPGTRPRVGMTWSGRSTHANDRVRSIGIDGLRPLLSSDFQFHALGKDGVPAGVLDRIQDHANELHDFADTAALVSCLDLVITVDTAIAHLAGALGKPVWTMLAFAPDFRWMLERPDTPWYSTMRLFRQRRLGDWNGVTEALQHALQSFHPR